MPRTTERQQAAETLLDIYLATLLAESHVYPDSLFKVLHTFHLQRCKNVRSLKLFCSCSTCKYIVTVASPQ